jgi:hypothetical protein
LSYHRKSLPTHLLYATSNPTTSRTQLLRPRKIRHTLAYR